MTVAPSSAFPSFGLSLKTSSQTPFGSANAEQSSAGFVADAPSSAPPFGAAQASAIRSNAVTPAATGFGGWSSLPQDEEYRDMDFLTLATLSLVMRSWTMDAPFVELYRERVLNELQILYLCYSLVEHCCKDSR
jgi:hypothetical protein